MEHQDLNGFTSTSVLSEMAHRLMTLEACAQFAWPFAGIAQKLRQHPARIQTLRRFRQAINEVPQYRIQVLTIAASLIDAAAAISQQHGILSNDALIAAIMRQHGLTDLASNDGDFDRVSGITRYAPT
ncbi:MAG TPA: PIN domain-containing protein [Gemmataceae bacterium]|nr:PIN domain-containing protein [Gemmataceae bacterium]